MNSRKAYSKRALLLLNSMNCGSIGLSAIKVISVFSDIPLIRELAQGIKDLQDENKALMDKLNSQKKPLEEEDPGEIEIDWEFKYKQLEVELRARDKVELKKRLAEADSTKRSRAVKCQDSACGKYAILNAARNGDLEKVKSIVSEDPKAMDYRENSYPFYYPLELAIINGHLDVVKFLVEKGSLSDRIMNGSSSSPVTLAIEKHQVEILKYFISIDADLD